MNIAEWSIKHSVITWVMTAVVAVAGIVAFQGLPRLEDPEFTIKEAMIYTPYPGIRLGSGGRSQQRDREGGAGTGATRLRGVPFLA